MTLYEQKENSLPSFFDDDNQTLSSQQLKPVSPPPTMTSSASFLNDFLSNNDVQNLSSSMMAQPVNVSNSTNLTQNVPSSRTSLVAKVPPPPPSFNQPTQSTQPQYQPQSFSTPQQFSTLSYQPMQPPQLQSQPQQNISLPTSSIQSQSQSQQMNAIAKLTETLAKFMASVDQRLDALEKTTREILVYQKTQKEFYQQQCNQLLTKMNELIEAQEKDKKEKTVPSYQTTSTTSTTFTQTKSEREREREQELADAQLAAQLQSQLDQESRVQQAPPREPEEQCPLCGMKFPIAVLEKHCNDVHFNTDGGTRTQEQGNKTQPQEQSWLAKWFGPKSEPQPTQQPRPQNLMATSSSPNMQPYILAPAYVQNSQQPVLFRPGQVPPGYSQVYYDSAGNVYNPNPNVNRSSTGVNTNY